MCSIDVYWVLMVHGKEASDIICQFGKKVQWYVPKKQRAEFDVRWRHGNFLGRSMSSDKTCLGLADGSVTCARAMVRLTPKNKWDTGKIGNIKAMPMEFKTRNLDMIEQGTEPHAHAPTGDETNAPDTVADAKGRRTRISCKHLQEYGISEGCHRCSLHRPDLHARATHSRHCDSLRNRMYRRNPS